MAGVGNMGEKEQNVKNYAIAKWNYVSKFGLDPKTMTQEIF